LSIAEEKKTRRFSFLSFQSIGIAASVLVLVSLGLFFFNQNEAVVKSEDNIVVKEKINSNNNIKINGNSLNPNQQIAVIKNQQSKSSNQKSLPSFNQNNQNNQKTTVNPVINQNKEIQFQNQEVIAQKELTQVDTRNVIVISKSTSVNTDDLLASTSKKSESKPKIKINANSLLSQVDGELDQTFREKVINRVSKNYQEVKVALATRNQE